MLQYIRAPLTQWRCVQAGSLDERNASFVGHQIRSDTSVVYGDGFRIALTAYQNMGLDALLKHVSQYKAIPV